MHWGPYSVPGLVSEWFWAYWKSGNKEITDFMKKTIHRISNIKNLDLCLEQSFLMPLNGPLLWDLQGLNILFSQVNTMMALRTGQVAEILDGMQKMLGYCWRALESFCF